jgi:hypothetical protein
MSHPNIQIHNSATGEIEIRKMNNDELAQWEADQAVIATEAAAKTEAAAAKAAAEAKLAALGLTSDDLKALGLGGN